MNKFKVEMILNFKDRVPLQKQFKNYKYILTVLPEASTVDEKLGDNLTLFDINLKLENVVDQLNIMKKDFKKDIE